MAMLKTRTETLLDQAREPYLSRTYGRGEDVVADEVATGVYALVQALEAVVNELAEVRELLEKRLPNSN